MGWQFIVVAAHASRYVCTVHLARLRLRDFRNYAKLDVDFTPGFHVLLGDNAQGKTNILESIYLLATLRSFRGVGGAHACRGRSRRAANPLLPQSDGPA